MPSRSPKRRTTLAGDPPGVSDTGTRLAKRWLLLARGGWVVLVALALGLYVAALPAYIARLETACVADRCDLTPAQLHSLLGFGITIGQYAAFNVAISLVYVLVSLVVSVVLFWRKADDWMALLVALMLVLLGVNNTTNALQGSTHALGVVATLLDSCTLGLLILVFCLFPDGRFIPRWTRWLVPAWFAVQLPGIILPGFAAPLWFDFVRFPSFYGCLIVAQTYRFRRWSGPVQREQTKWVVLAIVALLLVNIAGTLPYVLVPALQQPGSLYLVIFLTFIHVSVSVLPLAFGIAILRYRLYDIDLLINRSLVYGMLSGVLALIYFGAVVGAQRVTQSITGQSGQSQVIIVASTLLIAALFHPLRVRLQTTVDRRFYRRKYDAAQIVARFATTLRSQIDLNRLTAELEAVVRETVQPAHVSLWLRPPVPHEGPVTYYAGRHSGQGEPMRPVPPDDLTTPERTMPA